MNKTVLLIFRILVAIILLQTLRFKFLGHPDSVYIFSTIGMEPYGRYGIGFLELIASGLLFFKRSTWMGALMTTGLMAGAIFFHLSQLGIEVKNDGGTLFYMAVGTWAISLIILWSERKNIPFIN